MDTVFSHSLWDGPKTNHISKLWERFLKTESLPQLDRWLAKTLKEYRQFGKRDRLAYADALFAIARHSGTALVFEQGFRANVTPTDLIKVWREQWPASEEQWIASLNALPVANFFSWIALFQEKNITMQSNSGKQRAQWFRRLMTELPPENFELVLAGIPPKLENSLASRVRLSGWNKERSTQFLLRQHLRPPLWLRLNRPNELERVMAELKAKGLAPEADGFAIAVRGSAGVQSLDCYRDGTVEIQDLASQFIVETLAPQPGEHIWDACTGGGGKAVAIGARLDNRGMVHASDIREHKLVELRRRASKAGLTNIRCFAADARMEQKWNTHIRQRGGFDRVLVDAPCSGTGTWRRNPDNRWHINQDTIDRLVRLQKQLIVATSGSVRPGGKLVYATCSWLTEENEEIVRFFLENQAGWSLEVMRLSGSPDADADTMFCACLRRNL